MSKIKYLLIALFFILLKPVFAINITNSLGWLEAITIKWESTKDADKYSLYISGEGLKDYRVDDMLIRKYIDGYRADIPGLKSGVYSVKITGYNGQLAVDSAQTAGIEVKAHDRSGFAFMNGRIPGAYKLDGTPKENAVIIYITEKNKDLISLHVNGASTNPCIGLQKILDGFKKGKDNRPLIVRLIGQINDLAYMLNGDIVIENNNNTNSSITFEGIGDDAIANGWGIRIKNATNIELRNLAFMNCNSSEGDNVGVQQNNDYIWVHNCDFFYGEPGSDADQVKGDGALDCKRSTYVTFSYNHFWDTGKSNLLGLSENTTEGLYITYHHNWYDHSDSRHPRVRYYSAHVYNNYYDGVSKYGVGSTEGSSVFVESNFFRNCKYPMLISMQGSDVFNESTGKNDYSNMPTFSKENGGIIKAFGNEISGQKRFVAYGADNFPNSSIDFDAVTVNQRDTKITSSIVCYQGKTSYNNFDTDSLKMYSYTPDSPSDAKNKVMIYSGRMHGGDFKWTFNNAVDDYLDQINTALKNALKNYSTKLVAIQGETTTGIANYKIEEIQIYPNPATNSLYFKSENKIKKVEIFNSDGKCQMVVKGNTSTIDISKLITSKYNIAIYTTDGVFFKSFIKK